MKYCLLLFALVFVTGLLTLTCCSFVPQQTANNLPVAAVPSASATDVSRIDATETPIIQLDAWTQARAQLPPNIPVYKPTWVPDRLGVPHLEEARVDATEGPMYTITYLAQDESLVFILNLGKGALGNDPPSKELETEYLTILGVEGTLTVTHDTHEILVNWQKQGNRYQIKALTQRMTKDEMKRIVESLTPVPALQ